MTNSDKERLGGIMSVKVGTKLNDYVVTMELKNEHPIFGDMYVLQSKTETLKLYELELMNNIDLWRERGVL